MTEIAGTKPDGGTSRAAKRITKNENFLLVMVLIAVIGAMAVATKGASAKLENINVILIASANRGLASIGQTFVILAGGIDLSVAGVATVCSMFGATMMTDILYANIIGYPLPTHLAVPIMLVIGIGFGALNGLSVSRLLLPPLIVTLAFWQITQGIAFQVGLGSSVYGLPDSFAFFGQGRIGPLAVPGAIFIGVAAVAYFVLGHTPFGKRIYAVGSNPLSTWLSGVNVKNTQFATYVISGCLAALAGVVSTSRIMNAATISIQGLEVDSIVSCAVGGISLAGGKGNIIGAVIGVLIIGVINNGSSIMGADPAVQGMLKGGIIIAAVAIDYLRRR